MSRGRSCWGSGSGASGRESDNSRTSSGSGSRRVGSGSGPQEKNNYFFSGPSPDADGWPSTSDAVPRIRDGPAGSPAVTGMLAYPTLPPVAPRPARPGGLAGPRLSRGRPRRRADPQDQLRAGRLYPGVPRPATRRWARRPSPRRGTGPDPRRLYPAGHRLVLPAGDPGQLPGRRRPRGDVPGGRATGHDAEQFVQHDLAE